MAFGNLFRSTSNKATPDDEHLLAEIQGLVASVTCGQLSARAAVDQFSGGWADLVEGVNTLLAIFHDSLKPVANAIERVASSSQHIAASSQSVADGASEQASALEETAASLEEMSGQIKEALMFDSLALKEFGPAVGADPGA